MRLKIRTIQMVPVVIFLACLMIPTVAFSKELATTFEYGVLGWSNDSSLWGFYEKGDYGCEMLYQPGVGFFVIDASKNDFAYKFSKHVGELPDQSAGKSIAEGWEKQSRNKIKNMGLKGNMGTVVYQKPKMVWVEYDSQFKQFGEREVAFNNSGTSYSVKLEDSYIEGQKTLSGKKSMFTLSIRKEKGAWITLQADKKAWRPYIAYRIIYVSVSPDTKMIAVLIEAVEHSQEGQKQSAFKGATGLLP